MEGKKAKLIIAAVLFIMLLGAVVYMNLPAAEPGAGVPSDQAQQVDQAVQSIAEKQPAAPSEPAPGTDSRQLRPGKQFAPQ